MSVRALKTAELNQGVAADPANSVFVTANAGSGKTKVLVDRIARLLLQGSPPSAFLCITYTKAAAAEMQSRLFERLGGWCVADDKSLARDLEALGEGHADLGRARALFAKALETPGGLRIQTIHAFCERLLARFPLEAGVAPGFDIADEARSAALLSRARAEAALGADAPIKAFERFAAKLHGEALEGLLDRLALKRADFHRFAQLHQGPIFADAAIRNRHNARGDAEAFARAFIARHDWAKLQEAANALALGTKQDQDGAERLRAVMAFIEAEAHREALEACFDVALTGAGQLRANFATATTKKNHPWLEPLVRRLAEDAELAREELNALERAEDATALLALALKLDQSYEDAKAAIGALDFDDLIAHAERLLQSAEAAPWVLYKLDGGLDHILIDEGQDTSPAQWQLIAPLQDEFFAGAGARDKRRTVFAVGDPKQSIYGFQGADPERFLGEKLKLSKRALRADAKFKAPVLETSFRSSPEILAVVDATFAKLALSADALGKPEPEERQAKQAKQIRHLAWRDRQPGCVEVWPLARRPAVKPAEPWDAPVDVEIGVSAHAVLAKRIAERIRGAISDGEAVWDKQTQTLRVIRPGDVLALVRTRGALFRELIKAFKRAGLPVAGADRMVLRDELAVQDCLALMRVALDPADDLALACVLKGPWCGLEDDDVDLFPLASDRARGETLYSRLQAARGAKYQQARGFVEALIARAGLDAFAFLSWALETSHPGCGPGWSAVLGRLGLETRDPLEELLARALKPSAFSAATLQRFLYDVEIDAGQVKRELEAETGVIRVMTVHGAKGLEAPVVILPDSTGAVNEKPDDNLIIDENGPYFSRREADDDAPGRAIRAAYKERMRGEHWRLLYVAMTRARDRLIVCGAQHGVSEDGEDKQSWRAAVEAAMRPMAGVHPCATAFGEGLRLGAPMFAPKDAAKPSATPILPAWAKIPAPGATPMGFASPSRAARVELPMVSPRGDAQRRFRRGQLLHGLLERLPEVAIARREHAAKIWLARQGLSEEEAQLYACEALRIINDARFGALFGPMSRAEAAIVGVAAGRAVRGVVDRLAVDAARVMVLDYKTDRPAPSNAAEAPLAYVTQLALYREVLRVVFPGKRVDCALLWTQQPLLMELAPTQLDAAFAQFAGG